jgi:radical SAM superfamily enzyme YgiQ (UPF0313 family)
MTAGSDPQIRAVLVSLYSQRYPAIGESHGLSVVAGSLCAAFSARDLQIEVLDMVQWGEEELDRVLAAIGDLQANALIIGLPYGTFTVFERQYSSLRAAMVEPGSLIVLGGPIATYQSERLLLEIAPEAVVVLGEAEETVPDLVRHWRLGHRIDHLSGLHFLSPDGTQVRTARKLANLANSPLPFRAHIPAIHRAGGQIFAESSRGCGWAACTFCLRGLTDIKGRSSEYRRKPATRVAEDLGALSRLGITDVTFADEDFLGPSLDEATNFVDQLKGLLRATPRFDASLTVHSVYSRKDSIDERARRERTLKTLAELGLQKAFLGIESCSPGQLRRYAKGHTRDEAVQATRTLQRMGIRVEIGVILFDPLCTLDEIRDSLTYMQDNDLVKLASNISNELRLQVSSRYLAVLRNYETQHGIKLYESPLDPDTLSYRYMFADPQVADLYRSVRAWNKRLYSLYYPAKSLSRFGATGAIGEAVIPLRAATAAFRDSCSKAMISAISAMQHLQGPEQVLDEHFGAAAVELATAVQRSLGGAFSAGKALHPVIRQAVESAQRTMTDFDEA